MKLKVTGGIRPRTQPTCDELALEIAKLILKALEPDNYAEHMADGPEAFDFLIGKGYYTGQQNISSPTEINFMALPCRAPKPKPCKRMYLSCFSATTGYEYMTTIAILMRLGNTKIAPGVRVQLEVTENDPNAMLCLYYVDDNSIFNTNARLGTMLDALQRMDLSKIEFKGLDPDFI